MSEAIPTIGTDLKLGNGATPTEVFTSIDGIVSMNGFGTQRSEIDTTTLKDTSKKFKLGLKDNGTLQLEINHDPADPQHQELRQMNEDGTSANFQLILSDEAPSTRYNFKAFVSQWSLRADVDNVYKTQVSLRITGDVTEDTVP